MDLMGFTQRFFSSTLLMSHSPSTLKFQGIALALLSRQLHTVVLPLCPFVCMSSPVFLLFVWYFWDIKVFCRLGAIFGSSLAASV